MARTPDAPGPESAEERPSRRPLLRRAWIAWVVALLVAAASVAGFLWLRSERDALRRDTAEANARLSELHTDAESEETSIARERETTTELTDALGTCVRAGRAAQALVSAWIDHLAAARDRAFDRAEELGRRINPLRRKANRALRGCEGEARDVGIL